MEFFGAFGAEGRWFDSTSSRHVGPWASPSPVIACMPDVAPCGCLAAKFDSCNSLPSSVYTLGLLVSILRCVRLYIKRKCMHIIVLLYINVPFAVTGNNLLV